MCWRVGAVWAFDSPRLEIALRVSDKLLTGEREDEQIDRINK